MYYSCNEWLYLQLSDPFTISHEYTWQIPGVHNLTFTHHFPNMAKISNVAFSYHSRFRTRVRSS